MRKRTLSPEDAEWADLTADRIVVLVVVVAVGWAALRKGQLPPWLIGVGGSAAVGTAWRTRRRLLGPKR
jgi:hypothetical protein